MRSSIPRQAVALILLFAGLAQALAQPTTRPNSGFPENRNIRGKVGENLSYFKNYAGRVLIDAAKQGEVPALVGADLKWVVFVGVSKGDKGYDGDYAITADEPLDFKITGGSPAKITAPGVVTVTVGDRPNITPQLQLLFMGRATLPKGIRVIRPRYTAEQATSQVFTTEYLDLLKNLNVGCIRLMDALRTNSSECTDNWCDPAATLWSVRGIGAPLEPLVLLANQLDADVWMNVPHKATDAYVRKAAELLLARLGPRKRVYLEYSNEAWNTGAGFSQSEYMKDQGAAAGLTARQFYAKRAAEVAAVFLDVWKDQAWRVVPILAGATNDSGVLTDGLKYLAGKPNPFRALSVAGYFNCPRTATTPDEAFAGLTLNARALWAGVQMAKFDAQVKSGPYEKVIYEWTASIETGSETLPALVNVDPRIAAPIAAWGEGAFGAGVSMACHFVPIAEFGNKGYAATDDVSKWTAKAEALAVLSAAHPHPPALSPQEQRIVELEAQLAASQAEAAAAKAIAVERGNKIEAAQAALK